MDSPSASLIPEASSSNHTFSRQVITIFEEGEPLIDGEPGDLKFVVKTAKDPKYVRQKNDLWLYQTISLEQALVALHSRYYPQIAHEISYSFLLALRMKSAHCLAEN